MKLFRHVFPVKMGNLPVGNFNRGFGFSGPEARVTSAPGRRGIAPSDLIAAARSASGDIANCLLLRQITRLSNSIELVPKKIFSRGSELGRSPAGLVQQTVQIVASHDLTLFVGHRLSSASWAAYDSVP